MDWLKRALVHNWWLKLLSLALAYGLWAMVMQAPRVEVGLWVPLEVHGLPAHLRVSGEIPDRVHLHLRGPESRLRALRSEEVGVVLDLSGAVAGNHVIILNERNVERPPGIEVLRIIPDEVRLQVLPH